MRMTKTERASRRGRGSRSKGNGAERQVAKLCEAWWQQVEPRARFERTPMSGGHRAAGEFEIAGDIMTTASLWPFVVEVKRREGWSLCQLFDGGPSPVWAWWDEAMVAAKQQGESRPMLWLKRNREPWIVLVDSDIVRVGQMTPHMMFMGIIAFTAPNLLSKRPESILRLD